MTGRWRVRWWLVVGLVVLAGCGSDDAGDESSAGGEVEPAPALLQTADDGGDARREIVYTADLVVRVESVPDATGTVTDAVEEAGGFLFSRNTDPDGTTLVVKVPADRFDAVLDTVAGLGRELRHEVSADDVTAEVVDIEGRLETAQASAARLRELLAEAATTGDLVAVEGALTEREAEVESLQGRLRVLRDQVALSTLTVELTERSELQVSDDLPGFLDGLRTGWVALANVGLALVVVVGFLLPFLPLAVVAWWLIRRRRRNRPAQAPPGRPGPPGWYPPPTPAPTQPDAAEAPAGRTD